MPVQWFWRTKGNQIKDLGERSSVGEHLPSMCAVSDSVLSY